MNSFLTTTGCHLMQATVPLQQIIGVDKKNPYFTICKNPRQPGKLLVYFGTALLETVEDDRDHPSFKLLVARLYNSRLKVKTLMDSFNVPYTTMRRWGEALQSGDTETLLRVLAGRQHPRKLTPEIRSFARQRFKDIYPDNRYSYSQQLRQEIREVFDVCLSGETLRPYLSAWKKDWEQGAPVETVRETEEDRPGTDPDEAPEHGGAELENDREVAFDDTETPSSGGREEPNRKHAVIFPAPRQAPGYRFCHHAGLLLFSGFLNRFREVLGAPGEWIKQWVAMILLGATNIEQSKLLGRDALRMLLGAVVTHLHQQRQALAELTVTDCFSALLRMNGEWVGIDQCRDFYYDPHSKHYTGGHQLLKGWCSRLRFAEKVLHMDFIHTARGFPVYLHHDDNYYDLRERYFKVVRRFRQQFGFAAERPLTFIIDRGVYSLDVFNRINKEEEKTYFVTWEKGYRNQPVESVEWTGRCQLYKAKNSSSHMNCYAFQYRDESWPRAKNIRRLIVQATNPKGNSIQVSILTNDLERPARELIELMFSRWLQENDFKYLDVHFGINEITSYGAIHYQELKTVLDDKQIKSGEYKALEKQRAAIKKQLQGYLLRKHCARKDNKKRRQKIDELTQKLAQVELELSQTDKEVSRLQSLIEEDFYKLDTAKKQLMDGIKITARNLFYLLFQPFKEAYDNFRDDHVLFRHLTRSHGLVQQQDNTVDVLLLTEADFPPKVVAIFEDMLMRLNESLPTMPDGSGRRLKLRLLQNESILFTVKKGGVSGAKV